MHSEHLLQTMFAVQPGVDTVALAAKQGRILPEYFMLNSLDLFLFCFPTYRKVDRCIRYHGFLNIFLGSALTSRYIYIYIYIYFDSPFLAHFRGNSAQHP